MKAKVKWFNDVKGYGFLTAEETGRLSEIFCHYTAITGGGFQSISEGQEVEFDLIEGPKGPQASNVTKLPKTDKEST